MFLGTKFENLVEHLMSSHENSARLCWRKTDGLILPDLFKVLDRQAGKGEGEVRVQAEEDGAAGDDFMSLYLSISTKTLSGQYPRIRAKMPFKRQRKKFI
jgi:hypothetical protein